MSYIVSSNDLSNIRLSESDYVQSILQNIAVILSTPKGNVPGYREFGIDATFIDKPINVAQAMMCVSIKEAIEQYEPRAEYVGTTFDIDPNTPGKLIPKVEVKINE